MTQVQREAIQAVEQDGIVFIDEIDKIVVNQDVRYGEAVCRSCWYLDHAPTHVVWPSQGVSMRLALILK